MVDRAGLFESALDCLTEGLALTAQDGRIAFWNHAAETITGYSAGETMGHTVHEMLEIVVVGGLQHWISRTDTESAAHRGTLVQIRHKLDHVFPVFARALILRDGLGERIGNGVIFHPTDRLDALPRGAFSDGLGPASESQGEFEERLAAMHEDFLSSGTPFGLMWVTVDQAVDLRQTHGGRAVEAMLEKMERTLTECLKPAEEVGRWGDNEFLVLSHEPNLAMLTAHARVLAGMARTTDFRWWGDRISLTVSAGVAWAGPGEALSALLERAQGAMFGSIHAGGNQVMASPGSGKCSQ